MDEKRSILSALERSGVGITMVLVGLVMTVTTWWWLPRIDLCILHGLIATLLMFVGGYIITDGTGQIKIHGKSRGGI